MGGVAMWLKKMGVAMLKKKFLKLSILLVVALLISTTLVFNIFLEDNDSVIITTDAILPDVPNEMYILNAVSKDMTSENAKTLASTLFNVNGNPVLVNGAWRIYDNQNNLEVSIFQTGVIIFYDNTKMDNQGYPLEQMPSETACKTASEQFIGNLKSQGLTGNLQLSFKDIVKDVTVIGNINGSRTSLINNIHVNFEISYDNIRLWGPGATVRVYFDNHGDIIGFKGAFWSIEANQKSTILTPTQAIDKLNEVGFGTSMDKSLVSNATVKSVNLVYYVASPEAQYTQIVPAYVIKGEVTGKDNTVSEFAQIVMAVG